jgi:hypothetical protein
VAVVVGSEGQGLGPAVRRRCDTVVRIPMRGRISSLNAAVAGSILLYEASSQRGGDRPLVGPEPGTQDLASQVIAAAVAEPEAEPASKPKLRRRSAVSSDPVEPPTELALGQPAERPVESAEEALLPGASAIDSSDAATAE